MKARVFVGTVQDIRRPPAYLVEQVINRMVQEIIAQRRRAAACRILKFRA